jgi:hypothetical protein
MVAKPLVCHRRNHDEWMGLFGLLVKQRHGLGASQNANFLIPEVSYLHS